MTEDIIYCIGGVTDLDTKIKDFIQEKFPDWNPEQRKLRQDGYRYYLYVIDENILARLSYLNYKDRVLVRLYEWSECGRGRIRSTPIPKVSEGGTKMPVKGYPTRQLLSLVEALQISPKEKTPSVVDDLTDTLSKRTEKKPPPIERHSFKIIFDNDARCQAILSWLSSQGVDKLEDGNDHDVRGRPAFLINKPAVADYGYQIALLLANNRELLGGGFNLYHRKKSAREKWERWLENKPESMRKIGGEFRNYKIKH